MDYFVEKLWTQLPSCWLEVIKDFDVADLVTFLSSEETVRCQTPWPLSLLAFRASAFSLALSRRSLKSLKVFENFLSENLDPLNEKSPLSQSSTESNLFHIDDEFDKKSGQHKIIPEFCRRHVKPKKQHEIYRLAKVTDLVLKRFKLNNVIDVGSGLGHLSRLLSFSYNYNVATIESNHHHVSGATRYDKQAFSSVRKLKKSSALCGEAEALPHHMEGSITLSSSEKCLEKLLDQAFYQEDFNSCGKFALLGLHTCGNLAETILKAFVKHEDSQILLSVGCCYMKLDPNGEEDGYPLSSFYKSLRNHELSYEAKEMACHALDQYIKRLQDNAPSLKIHCYRATLEKCIRHQYPELKHLGLRGVKRAELMEFSDYAEQALSKVSITIPEDSLKDPEVQLCLSRWKEVLVFYSLRLLVAPVVESSILLDRLLYLFEQGCSSCLAAIFDPNISPRNHILLSVKCNNKIN